MNRSLLRLCAFLFLLVGLGAAPRANATCPACVAAIEQMNVQVNVSLNTMHTDLARLLQGIGQSINANGAKVAAQIEANGNADRSLAIRLHTDDRVSRAAESFAIPDSVCANSASGGMQEALATARGGAGGFRRGGASAGNALIDKAVNDPAVAPTADQRRATAVHAMYCDTVDYKAYGGTKACPAVSTMPGADKRMDSLLAGAGADGKAPDLTFSPQQTDAARMYLQNSVYRSISRELSKGEAATPAGIEYIGLRTQYDALMNAAAEPQRTAIASRQPEPQTKALLQDALQTPSASSYFDQTASPEAKRLGYVSYAELEQFEVGRRYANTDYETDLQSMTGDNLVREQIRVSALNAWLLLEMKNEIHRETIIQGLLLASDGRSEYAPILQAKLQELNQSMGRTQ